MMPGFLDCLYDPSNLSRMILQKASMQMKLKENCPNDVRQRIEKIHQNVSLLQKDIYYQNYNSNEKIPIGMHLLHCELRIIGLLRL